MSAVDTLKQWAAEKKLEDVQASENGLTLGDATLANEALSFADNKSYSLLSVFLQIKSPDQKLMEYRNACKQYNVSDPVKAMDKAAVLSFFLGDQPSEAAPAPAEAPKEKKKEHRDKSSKDHHKRKKEHRDRSKDHKRKKEVKAVTNEELFSNLNVVVGKREMTATQQDIAHALSAEGFAVTPEMLEQDEETEFIVANEIPVGNSASILRAVNPRKDLKRVLELLEETRKPAIKPSTPRRDYLKGQKPVIVVPKGLTAPITLMNAHEFLANGKFVPRQQLQLQQKPPTTFTRTVQGGLLEYEIMDNPKKLKTAREWERVVAVLALGQDWQFKDWPGMYSNPVHLFHHTFGFYFGLEGDKIPEDLQKWNVQQAKLNRRGLDSIALASFWNGLDEWMKVHRRELLP